MMRLRATAVAAFAVWSASFAHAAEDRPALEPFQMVRSLQILQDRIADGDHAALPMQNKLLELIDKRFREATDADFEDRRNYRAMLVYGMSGGNPVTLEMLIGRLHLWPNDQRLAVGIQAYLTGRLRLAQNALKPFDATKLRPELGAFLSLVQGSLVAQETPTDALILLDQARLLGPGTLVEEAALRRTLDLTTKLKDARRFERAAEQYVRRFIRSPYASQFVDTLLSGVIALNGHVDLDTIADTIGLMTADQQRFVYLKLARISAIDNMADLNAFAAAKAKAVGGVDGEPDPRAMLYATAPSVTSETVEETLARLKTIDRTRLSENDRLLLDAAEAIAASVTAQPSIPQGAQHVGPQPEPTVVKADPRLGSPVVPAPSRELGNGTTDTAHDELLASARAKLEAVDTMLKDSTQ